MSSLSVSVSLDFSFVSVSSVQVIVSLTHVFGSWVGKSESCTALAWSWDGTIVVALVPCIQEDSSLYFPLFTRYMLVCCTRVMSFS